jgi:hypothetical protein
VTEGELLRWLYLAGIRDEEQAWRMVQIIRHESGGTIPDDEPRPP